MKEPTIADRIVTKLDNSFGMTRAELAQSLGLTRDGIRKALNMLVEKKKVQRDMGEDGIEYFSIEKEMESDFEELKPMEAVGQAMMEVFSYDKGFVDGFRAAKKLNELEAFTAGKMHVINKLKEILL